EISSCARCSWLSCFTFVLRFLEFAHDLVLSPGHTAEHCRDSVIFLQRRHMAVTHFHLRSRHHLCIPLGVENTHTDNMLKSLPAHRPGIHSQCATDFTRNPFHPFKTANAGVASGIRNLF